MTYAATKFEVARSTGIGGDIFTRNVMDTQTDGRTDGLYKIKALKIFIIKKRAGIIDVLVLFYCRTRETL